MVTRQPPPSRRQYVPQPLPGFLPFMHPTLVTRPPNGDIWFHEIKFDGYRVQVRVAGGHVAIFTRNGNDWTAKFPEIAEEASHLPDCILDAELCALDENGQSGFSALRASISPGKTAELVLMVFDVLWRGQDDLRRFELKDRKAILSGILNGASGGRLRYVPAHESGGEVLLRAACQIGVEGVVSKRRRSTYVDGRSELWLKAKCRAGQEVVIGGWVQPPGGIFKVLLVGTYEGSRLSYAGSVKTGFKGSSGLLTRLRSLQTDQSPFTLGSRPNKTSEINWVRPELVANVEFAEWTSSGKLRQASFKGLREDKDPLTVRREFPEAEPL
jgi:bifunctional non-homologous end joining protein LigD